MSSKTSLPVVLGTMTIGNAGLEGVRVSAVTEVKKMLDVFQSYGHNEVDEARVYGSGSSEEYMAKADWASRGLVMGTKLYPNKGKNLPLGNNFYSHHPDDVRRGLKESLEALQTRKVHLWYLHGPDRKTPLEDTLREVNKLYEQGLFDRFGISNYMSWEVAAICEICERNSWVKPVVYQAVYNVFQRSIEAELIPCLRHYGIAIYSFQPLAGGLLTSRYNRAMCDDDYEPGSRFDPKRGQGRIHRARYINDSYFKALDLLRSAMTKHNLTETQCAMRWLAHHSQLKKDWGDKIIVGASSAEQLETNLTDLQGGPLPQDVLDALEAGWLQAKAVVPKYHH